MPYVGHVCEPCYPASLPVEAVKYLVGALRGAPSDKECLAHCGWVVLGYGLSLALPHPCPVMTCPPDECPARLCTLLEGELAVRAPGAPAAADTLPWGEIVGLLVELLKLWLKK